MVASVGYPELAVVSIDSYTAGNLSVVLERPLAQEVNED